MWKLSVKCTRSWKFNFSTIWIFLKYHDYYHQSSKLFKGLDARNECPHILFHSPHSESAQPRLDILYQPTNASRKLHFWIYLGKKWLKAVCRVSYWSCWCIGRAICGGTLMNRSLSSKPTGLLVSLKSLSSCSTMLFAQFFSQKLRTNSLICSAHWVP